MRICIDPGHGGKDPGAVGLFGTKEKDLMLAIAVALHDLLIDGFHQVILTRTSDRHVSLEMRCSFANGFDADLFLSLHCNAAENRDVSGIEVYTFSGLTEADMWAERFQDALLKRFKGHKDFAGRGPSEANFFVLKKTAMSAVLIECEFISNPVQEVFLKENVVEIAKCIAYELGTTTGWHTQ